MASFWKKNGDYAICTLNALIDEIYSVFVIVTEGLVHTAMLEYLSVL